MKKYAIIFVAVVCAAVSCSKELDVAPPNSITTDQVLGLLNNSDETTRKSIFQGMTASLHLLINRNDPGSGALEYRYNNFTGSGVMRGFEGNDMVFANTSAVAYSTAFGREEYQYVNIRGASGAHFFYWKQGYQFVAQANKILNFLTDDVVGESADLKKFQAYALFIRAFGYNHLLENYQDAYTLAGGSKLGVPLYTKFDPTQPYQARATLEQCYKLINDDLNLAIDNLTFNGASGFTDAKNDIDVGAAYFLRARVSLCMGNWGQAISDCQKIIDKYGTAFMTETQYVAQKQIADGKDQYFAINSGFLNLAQNPETVFGFTWDDRTGGTSPYPTVSYWLNVYGTGTSQGSLRGFNVQIDQQLYDKIADADYRKKNFLGPTGGYNYTYADGTVQAILPYANLKFASTVGKPGGTNTADAKNNSYQNDWTLMRLSEVYLMLAEAQANTTGGESAAKTTLDKLISARTNGTYDSDTYPSHASLTMLQKVQLQTRIEMWGENGLEFYNNRRWNIAVNRSASANHWTKSPISVPEMTMQIPSQSISLNGLLEQNP